MPLFLAVPNPIGFSHFHERRELVMQIPISNPAATQDGVKIALSAVCTLQNDLRFVLHLHREGQRSFAKKAESVKKHTKQLKPAEQKTAQIRA